MYFATVDLATWIPSLVSSPTILGEPQPGFALDIVRMRSSIDLATAGLPGLPMGEASPMLAESPPLPGDDGAGLDEDQDVPPAGPGPGQPRPQESIGDLGASSPRAPLVDGELVAQREDLELEGDSRPEACAEGGEDGEEDFLSWAAH